MELLPDERERDEVIEGLAELVDDQGFEVFVAARLLEPDARFFPDPWEPTSRGVRALALRLLLHAGITELDVFVSEEDPAEAHGGDAVWFEGIDGGVCTFGVQAQLLSKEEAPLGPLCREVARALRVFADIAVASPALEETSIDLTTIYLGFGVLTTNHSYRFRTEGMGTLGDLGRAKWSMSFAGALPTQAMAFGLAAQVIARGMSTKETKRVAALLEPSQRDFFEAAFEHLAPDADRLRRRLGLPPSERWPEPRDIVEGPLRADARFDPRDGLAAAKHRVRNASGNVFRVRERKIALPLYGGLAVSVAVGTLVSSNAVIGVAVGLVGGACGAALGWARYSDSCSNQGCGAVIPARVARCPGCGGKVRGVVRSEAERLAAEDALGEEPDDSTSTPYRG